MKRRQITTFLASLIPVPAVGVWLSRTASAAQQQAAEPRRRPAGGRPAPVAEDNTGFEPLFDGKTLGGWDGEPGYWRVEDGAIVGETTPEKMLKQNSFLIWRGGTAKDFELKAEYRISAREGSNSGINFRSAVAEEAGRWVMKGYQANIDGLDRFSGEIYEERARGLLAPRGTATRVAADGRTRLLGSLGESEALKAFIRSGGWNRFHLIVRGTAILAIINGHVMSSVVDDDLEGRAMEGLFGLQLHNGPPMKIEFRDILLRRL